VTVPRAAFACASSASQAARSARSPVHPIASSGRGADFTASAQYAAGERANHDGVVSLGGFYNAGPVTAGIAWERNHQIRGAGLYDNAVSVALSYSTRWADIGGVYERLDYDTAGGNLTRDFWGLGVTVPLGPGAAYAFFGHAGEGRGNAPEGTRVGGLARGDGSSANQFSLSYTYVLSKRTLVYAGFVRIDNRSNASYSLNINPYPTPIGGRPAGLVVGAAHFF
jgi:predicted porin